MTIPALEVRDPWFAYPDGGLALSGVDLTIMPGERVAVLGARTVRARPALPTVREDVASGPANLGLRGEALEVLVRAALEAVGMAEYADRAPHHLSFGARRRVAAATVLAMDRGAIVADERTIEILSDEHLMRANRLESPPTGSSRRAAAGTAGPG